MRRAIRRFFARLINFCAPVAGRTISRARSHRISPCSRTSIAAAACRRTRRGAPRGSRRRRRAGRRSFTRRRSFPVAGRCAAGCRLCGADAAAQSVRDGDRPASLAIGIGANTAVFTVANALLFRGPAGVADAGSSRGHRRRPPRRRVQSPARFPTYPDVRDRAESLAGVYAQQMFPGAMSLDRGTTGSVSPASTEPALPNAVFGHSVTSNYFAVLGVQASVGRMFDAAGDGRPGRSSVVVLSHRFWAAVQRRCGGGRPDNPSNGQPFTVIGVAPEGFQGTGDHGGGRVDAAERAACHERADRGDLRDRDGGWLVMGGRLKPGVSVEAAAAEVDALGQALALEYPNPPSEGPPPAAVLARAGQPRAGRGVRRAADGDGVLRAPRRVRERLRHSAGARGRTAAGDRGAVVARRRARAARPPAAHGDGTALCDWRRRRLRAGARGDLV